MSQRRLTLPSLVLLLAAAGLSCREQPRAITAPGIVDVTALDKEGKQPRALGPKPVLSRDEALDFHVEMFDPGFVYVFRAAADRVTLEWGPGPDAKPLEPGTWAPEWSDERVKGLRFNDGEALLFVLATAEQLHDASWSQADLEQPRRRCPLCASTTLRLTVTAPASTDAGP